MAGLITYYGKILLAGGGLAGSKDCCCGHRNCYCFTKTVNYQVVSRWMKCYRDPIWDTINSTWIYPDGMPCDGGTNGQICPPGSTGRYVTMTGNAVQICGCSGASGTAWSASLITNQSQYNNCTTFGDPP